MSSSVSQPDPVMHDFEDSPEGERLRGLTRQRPGWSAWAQATFVLVISGTIAFIGILGGAIAPLQASNAISLFATPKPNCMIADTFVDEHLLGQLAREVPAMFLAEIASRVRSRARRRRCARLSASR